MNASGKEIARTALLGLAVGLITPVRLGELVGVAPFPRSDRGKAILSHGYDRLYELFAVLVFSLPAAFLLLGWTGRLVSVAIVALYGLGIAVAQSAYWRPKFGGFSLLGKCRSSKLCSAPLSSPRRSIGCCPSPTSSPATSC